jgi:hypothetical protein
MTCIIALISRPALRVPLPATDARLPARPSAQFQRQRADSPLPAQPLRPPTRPPPATDQPPSTHDSDLNPSWAARLSKGHRETGRLAESNMFSESASRPRVWMARAACRVVGLRLDQPDSEPGLKFEPGCLWRRTARAEAEPEELARVPNRRPGPGSGRAWTGLGPGRRFGEGGHAGPGPARRSWNPCRPEGGEKA